MKRVILAFIICYFIILAIYGLGHLISLEEKELKEIPTPTQLQTPIPTPTPTPVQTPSDICIPCSNNYWRYDFVCALRCALRPKEIDLISNFAEELKGADIEESTWNILNWEKKWIKYEFIEPTDIKVKRTDHSFRIVGSVPLYHTPSETCYNKRGNCGDYAILTAALLLKMGYKPYVLVVAFEDGEFHAATAVEIKGEFFVLDQIPPIMDLPTYYNHWAYYADNRHIIDNITVYEVRITEGEVNVTEMGTFDISMYLDRIITQEDLQRIQEDIVALIEKEYPIELDYNLKDYDEDWYLPWGYTEGRSWKITLKNCADYYNPKAHKHYIKYIFDRLMNYENWKDSKKYGMFLKDFSNSNRFWLKVEADKSDLIFTFNLARQIYGY